jgi:large subunit ribosomal protein L30
MSAAEEQQTLRIKLVKSPIGYSKRQRRTLQALGLRKLYSSVVQADTPAIRGMVAKVNHLVEVEEVEKE